MRFLVLSLLALGAFALADTVSVRGKKVRGTIVSEDPEVVINEFNSTVPGVVLGTHRFPKDKVRKVVRTKPAPHHEFQRRLAEVVDADGCLRLAEYCAKNKLREERLVALERALRFDPDHAQARKLLGSKAPRGSWPEQIALAREYVQAEDAAARSAALARIRRDPHFPFKELYLQRAWRSARQPKGYTKDRPVALRADKLKENARYTLVVPSGKYDPLMPTPLVIGLHGGGPGGADGKLVVGAGHQAMSFYQHRAEARGWICACPTAVQAGWSGPNDDLIDTLLDELCALYNIDENRIYLVGHSMGGGGTWRQGTRIPEVWAAIAPAASFGVPGFGALEKTRTGFYVYHSDDDPRTRVEGVRPRMLPLAGSDTDFVYTELPNRQHGFPGEVIDDIFRFFAMRTLARGPGRFKPQARPLSSFLRKVSRDEKKYLPGLATEDAAAPESLSALLKDLRTGGGVAEQSVPKLVAHPDAKTSASVARILLKSTSGPDVRRYAATVLGGRKAADQLKALGRVLLVETESNALLAVLGAIEEIGRPEAGDDVLRFLKKRREYLEKRTQGKEMHHSDWETIVPTMARACALVGTFKPAKAAAVIENTVVDGCFLSATGVVFDRQNQNPRPAARALGQAACAALAQLGGDEARAALAKLRKAGEGASDVDLTVKYGPVAVMRGWAKDPVIANAVREALDALSEGG